MGGCPGFSLRVNLSFQIGSYPFLSSHYLTHCLVNMCIYFFRYCLICSDLTCSLRNSLFCLSSTLNCHAPRMATYCSQNQFMVILTQQLFKHPNHGKVITRIQYTKNSSRNCNNNFVNIELQKDFVNLPGEILLNNLATY